jgi:signal peptidase I
MISGTGEGQAAWAPPAGTRRRIGRVIFWVLVVLSALVVLAGIGLAVGTTHRYYNAAGGSSMENTIRPGDVLIVAPGTTVRRGDVIIFHEPSSSFSPGGGPSVKRVIGLPGDHVACCNAQNQITVDGKGLGETYVKPGDQPSQRPFSVTLAAGQLYVLGDNRNVALDSRTFGPVRESRVIGRVVALGRGVSLRMVRTPQTYVAAGLAPGDHRLPPYVWGGLVIAVGVVALIVLAVFAIVSLAVRRFRARRDVPRGEATYGPAPM